MKIHPRGKSKYGHRYNWRPDLPDQRDLRFSISPKALPKAVDLRKECPPVVNQLKIGSCTGNALAGAMGFLEEMDLREKGGSDPHLYSVDTFEAVSRLFIYFNERLIEGTTGQDAGANLRDGIKSLAKVGVCREKVWKYSPSLTFTKPDAKSYKEASSHLITSYLALKNIEEMKHCLADGFPFVFGFSVYESFESPDVAKTGVMPMPASDEKLLGGHAVMAVGYDDSKKFFWVRNSWGTEWGQKGYFQMPFEYFETSGLAQDFWTIRQ
ncbi:MAG: peptidase [Bacteriovoracaceae bacterium]|nr:peptidase [Bacteriovoracaceae bacterium]